MLGIKEFNKKIGSLKNTRKMTKTMKMVSAAKFKRAHHAQHNALVYAKKLQELMSRVSSSGSGGHPLMVPKKIVKNISVVVFTSDKGLCGGFNNNLIRKVRLWLEERRVAGDKVTVSFCGRRGYMAFRRSQEVGVFYENVTLKPSFADALKIANDVSQAFLQGKCDEVYLCYNHFNGPISQVPVIEKLLPLQAEALASKDVKPIIADYIYEPETEEMFQFLVPKFLNFKIFFTLLENAAGEHGARMSAMDKASSNTADLIDKYTLLRNRARQASITKELIEIISGAEALK